MMNHPISDSSTFSDSTPNPFDTDATALKFITILFDANQISAETYHRILSKYSY